MFAIKGKEQITKVAQEYYCGRAFDGAGALAPACVRQVEAEVTSAYRSAGADPRRLKMLEEYLRHWYGRPYHLCLSSSGAVFDFNEERKGAGGACMAAFVRGDKRIAVGTQRFGAFGEKGYVAWAARQAKAGRAPSQVLRGYAFTAFPVRQALDGLARGDAMIREEAVRLCLEAMAKCPPEDRDRPMALDAVSLDVLAQLRGLAGRISADRLRRFAAILYVAEVHRTRRGPKVILREPPVSYFLRSARGTAISLQDEATLRELRRLFAQAWGQAEGFTMRRGEGQKSASFQEHLQSLKPAARGKVLDGLRERIASELVEQIHLAVQGLASGAIASRLAELDAAADLGMGDVEEPLEVRGIALGRRAAHSSRTKASVAIAPEAPTRREVPSGAGSQPASSPKKQSERIRNPWEEEVPYVGGPEASEQEEEPDEDADDSPDEPNEGKLPELGS